jgi:hypothetical protein
METRVMKYDNNLEELLHIINYYCKDVNITPTHINFEANETNAKKNIWYV